MSLGLFYTTRNVTGLFSAGLLTNLKILETAVDQVDWLTINKTDQGAKHIQKFAGLKIGQWLNYMLEPNGTTWDEVYGNLDPSPLAIYDKLFLMGGIHFPQSKLSRDTDRALKFPVGDKGQMKFQQVAKHMINVMLMHKAHVCYKIPLHEFCYETDEMSTQGWDVAQRPGLLHRYHVYDIPMYGMKRLDSLQYFYNNQSKSFPVQKEWDLTFGYTLYANGNRPAYVQWIEGMASKFKPKQIFVKDAINKENSKVVPFDEYLTKIEQSKYTLVIPSYDSNTFSMYRFIEAIQRGCLPILHPDCNVTDAEKSHGINLSQLKVHFPFKEVDRQDLIKYYRTKLMTFEQGFINE